MLERDRRRKSKGHPVGEVFLSDDRREASFWDSETTAVEEDELAAFSAFLS